MSRVIVTGDIHGCTRTFQTLIENQVKLKDEDQLILIGDYVNKGPDSKGTLDYIFELQSFFQVKILLGNHDQLMLDAQNGREHEDEWYIRGGDATLTSFGTDTIHDIPTKYFSFLNGLKKYLQLKDFLIVHAGFNFAEENIFLDENAMLTIREMDDAQISRTNKKIVHGHVPGPLKEFQLKWPADWWHISIDTGCVYTHLEDHGHLTAVDLKSGQTFHQKNVDLP